MERFKSFYPLFSLKNMLVAAKTCMDYRGLRKDLIDSTMKWRENQSREAHVVMRVTG